MKASYTKLNLLVRFPLLMILLPLLGWAQQNPSPATSDTSVLQALLAEVHELRLAMERSNALGPRMQLAVLRFQMQQTRVDRLERELRDIRNQLASESATKERATATLAQFEDQARQTQDLEIRRQSEAAVAATRQDLEQQAAREQQIRAQEAEISDQLKTEQDKLDQLSGRLDQLEKSLPQ